MRVQIDCAGATDVGKVRRNNQDHFLIAELNKSMLVQACSLPMDRQSRLFGSAQGHLLLVADGMGGHAAGERASLLAVDYMIERLLNSVHWFFRLKEDVEEDFLNDLKNLLLQAHRRILSDSNDHRENLGMGTTLTMAYAIWPRLYVVHAGDSRCYLIRGGEASCLTRDHTLARQLVESGGMRPEDESTSRWSNVLWNVLGGSRGADVTAEVVRADLQQGDTVLLCSDGLYRYVESAEMSRTCAEAESSAAACRALVDLANARGGQDNITVAIARFESTRPGNETMLQTSIPLSQALRVGGGDDEDPADEDTLPVFDDDEGRQLWL